MKNKAVKIVIISLASIVAAIAVAAVGAIIYCTMLKGGYIPSESELSLTSTVQNEQPGGETIKIKIRLNNKTGRRLPVVYGAPLCGKSFIGCSVLDKKGRTDFAQHLDQNLGIISKRGKTVEITVDTAGLKPGEYEITAWIRVKLSSEEKSVLSLNGVRYDDFDKEILIKSKPVAVKII